MATDLFDFVRGGDPERFAAALFAPTAVRGDLLALYAFDLELIRIGGLVREPMLGNIRLQWWAEAIAREADGRSADHPVAEAVAQAARRHALSFDDLQGLIAARQSAMSGEPIADRAAFESYADATSGRILALASMICGVRDVPHSTVQMAARAQTTIRSLRAEARRARAGHVVFPGPRDAAIRYASEKLAAFGLARHAIAPAAIPAFLPLTLERLALARLHARPDAPLNPARWRQIAALVVAAATRRP